MESAMSPGRRWPFARRQTRTRSVFNLVATAAAVAGAALAGPRDAHALLYDLDLSSPPHTVGQPPAIGAGPAPRETVTEIVNGNPMVVASLGALADQPLQLDSSDHTEDQIELQIDDLPASSFYCLHADVLVSGGDANGQLTVAILGPGVRNLHFQGDGRVMMYNALVNPASEELGTFTLGDVVHLGVEVDLVNDRWVVRLDEQVALDGDFGASDAITSVRVSTGGRNVLDRITGAIDNLTIEEDICNERPCDRLAFDALTAGTTYEEGSSFAAEGVIVEVGPFFFTAGQPCTGMTTSGFAEVDAGSQNACRTGNEIEINNVTLDFDFGDTVNDLVFYYGEYGGTVSLGINGDCRTVQNFPALDGTNQGGVLISVLTPAIRVNAA